MASIQIPPELQPEPWMRGNQCGVAAIDRGKKAENRPEYARSGGDQSVTEIT
jgi:hypothetical protein